MKYFWIIILFVFCGCDETEESKRIRCEIDKTTIRTSYYLSTVVHDEHLFILSKYGYFIHHPDCPCLKNRPIEKEENKLQPPTIFLDLIKGKQ